MSSGKVVLIAAVTGEGGEDLAEFLLENDMMSMVSRADSPRLMWIVWGIFSKISVKNISKFFYYGDLANLMNFSTYNSTGAAGMHIKICFIFESLILLNT